MKRKCSWAEAEEKLPGIGAEWDVFVAKPELFDGPKPGTFGLVSEVSLTLEDIDMGDGKEGWMVTVTPSYDKEGWLIPPTWVRQSDGTWYSPLPLPRFRLLEL